MWIKICGITSAADALFVLDAGAQAIGLNFYEKSRRFVDVRTAAVIADSVHASLDVVGVFVNTSPEEMARICDQLTLTAVQLHGDETPEATAEFQALRPDIAVVRALRIGTNTESLENQLQPWTLLNPPLDAVLVDTFVAGEYGGTGQRISPQHLSQHLSQRQSAARLILAGGLRPNNVSDAVRTFRPWGVDTAGGVETEPGRKSESLIRDFVQAARAAAPGIALEHLRS